MWKGIWKLVKPPLPSWPKENLKPIIWIWGWWHGQGPEIESTERNSKIFWSYLLNHTKPKVISYELWKRQSYCDLPKLPFLNSWITGTQSSSPWQITNFILHFFQEDFWTHPEQAILRAYKKTDKAILAQSPELGRGGSTAVTAILFMDRGKLWVANVGDSRAVLARGGTVIQMTVDHEPSSEKGAIENTGGFVSNLPGICFDLFLVYIFCISFSQHRRCICLFMFTLGIAIDQWVLTMNKKSFQSLSKIFFKTLKCCYGHYWNRNC